jgi:hypothetical protein
LKDYSSSEDYIRDLYTGEGREKKAQQKKPYWRIAADKFDASQVSIGPAPAIEIFEKQDFPSREDKVFALYIGNDEVMKRLGLDLGELNTLQKIYDVLISAREKNWSKSLIF